jgi:glycosyltransferase involved in cell wall biosynthesis
VNRSVEVSICIPTYNQTKYLRKTLDSIVSQTYQNFEIIVSDDSQTDEVEKLIHFYGEKYPLNLNYIRNNPSLGSPENWNNAISLAKGKWIKIMHHDDWFCEFTALDKIVQQAKNHPNSLVFSGIKGDFIKENRHYINLPSKQKIQAIKKDPFSLLWANVIGPPSTILFPKSIVQFDCKLIWLVDIEFYLQLLINNNLELIYIEEILFENCQDEHNISINCLQNKILELKEFNYIYTKFYPNSSLKNRFRFIRLLKAHISSYARVNYLELIYSHFKYMSK